MSSTVIKDFLYDTSPNPTYRTCELSGSEISRTFDLPPWNKICVGWMLDYHGAGGIIMDPPGMHIGLSSGTGSILNQDIGHFVGVRYCPPYGLILANATYDYVYNNATHYYIASSGSTTSWYSSSASPPTLMVHAGFDSTAYVGPHATAMIFTRDGSSGLQLSTVNMTTGNGSHLSLTKEKFVEGINRKDIIILDTIWSAVSSYYDTYDWGSINAKEDEYGALNSFVFSCPTIEGQYIISSVYIKIWEYA